MKLRTLGFGSLVGVMLAAPMIAMMYVAQKWVGLSFAPFDVFDWIARLLPGPVVTFGIDRMVDMLLLFGASVSGTAKTAEQAMAVGLFFAGVVVATIVVFWYVEARDQAEWVGLGPLAGVILGIPAGAIVAYIGQSTLHPAVNFLWVFALFVTWGNLTVKSGRKLLTVPPSEITEDDGEAPEERSVQVIDRRKFLIQMGVATATITVAGAGLGRNLAVSERERLENELAAIQSRQMPDMPPMIELPNEADPLKPALGTRPEYTAVRDHYQIFIRSQPTVIDGDTWELPITGLVDNPVNLTLSDIRNNYEPRNEFVTLSCISNRVGGDLISTTYWTGASLQDILAEVRPKSDARYMIIKSGDGFYETVDLDLINSDERIMLAYAWDGRPIPFDHGFPLRIWLPDRYGMKQPKWITEIEIVDEYVAGYWVERGWDKDAIVRATSVIDTVAVDSIVEKDGRKYVPIGGIAYAGVRGISKVEIQVYNRDEWYEAELRQPLSDASWVIWRVDWPFEEGNHDFEVRCVEADGARQVEEFNPPRPSGATGLHHKSEVIEARDA